MLANSKKTETMPKNKRKQKPPKKVDQVLYRSEAPSYSESKIYFKDKRYYFNVHIRRWKRHIDGDWDNGPLVYKIPLTPEQAVLACCQVNAGADVVRFHPVSTTRCERGVIGLGGLNVCSGATIGKANCGLENAESRFLSYTAPSS